ncbi:MAG TPA: helix-turn-helix domain-containing protein [Chitinophagaceae bacterium]|nr:helix-turn-helix domain-containing protein [Chitinophagaceae bacterium]
MLFELLSDENREIQFPGKIPLGYQKFLVPGSERLSANGSFGGMLFQQKAGEDFQIHYTNYLITERSSFRCRAPFALVELQFCLLRGVDYQLDPIGKLSLKRFHYNITYVPFTENRVEFFDRRYSTFDIHYSLDFLRRIAPDFPVLAGFLEKIEKGQAGQISLISPLASREMLSIIGKLLHPDTANQLEEFQTESLVKDLLIMGLQRLGQDQPPGSERFTDYEIECIREARRLMLTHMDEPMTIKELSQKVGINDFKLKRGFRQVFGTTMYFDFREERMKLAAGLLLDGGLSVQEISFRVGFRNVSNFSTAFRKRFGSTPSHWKKSR